MPIAESLFSTTNYMVPSNGQTHAVVFKGNFSPVPYYIDWRQYAIDNQNFQPQGVFIDNTAGATDLVIIVNPINYTVTCPAGLTLQAQFPAPNGQSAYVTGDPNNVATVTFVDFPVLPSSTQASIINAVNVNLQSANPAAIVSVTTDPMAASNTLPYRAQELVPNGEYRAIAITGAAVTANTTPTLANQNLRQLLVFLSGDASLAAAGLLTISGTLNGVAIFTRKIYLPAAAPATPAPGFDIIKLDNNMIGFNAAAGNLTITISAALTSGQLDALAYFAP